MLFSVPPRHGKTEAILHSLAWRLWIEPTAQLIYTGYSGQFAQSKSKRVREISTHLGLQLAQGSKRADEWMTVEGGGLRARGRDGTITGHGANLFVIDDPISNRAEAESPVIRQNVMDFFTSTAMTRVAPGGSIVIVHTRWHDDDLIGRLAEQGGWTYINLPALTDGVALWPAGGWTAAELAERRAVIGEYDFSSMYQGQPRPRGGRLFNDPARYDFPLEGLGEGKRWRIVIGADPAATEKTTADFSVAVVLAVTGQPGTVSYQAEVLDVFRAQIAVPKFAAKLVDLSRHWNAPVACEATGGFKAVPQVMRMIDRDVRVVEVNVSTDKFTRALPVAAAWNDGRVTVPSKAPWLRDFLAELTRFTGVKDSRDDQVDALVHGWNAVALAPNRPHLGVHNAPRDLVTP